MSDTQIVTDEIKDSYRAQLRRDAELVSLDHLVDSTEEYLVETMKVGGHKPDCIKYQIAWSRAFDRAVASIKGKAVVRSDFNRKQWRPAIWKEDAARSFKECTSCNKPAP